ncbi:MAG TPA: ATP-dependent Clp protease adapter ClpS [Bacteroidetes bacterium]|nr:ATP-dependent Clp protease adapter ClpS [Bacteroidota bacterium]
MSIKSPAGHTGLSEKVKTKLTEPPKYAVILLNDNYTTFEFVVKVLVTIFRKNVAESVQITNDVHRKGRGICGLYSKEIAETKVELVEQLSKKEGHPLKCVTEKT